MIDAKIVVDSSANNGGAKVFRVLGGDLTYSLMTTQVIDGNFVSLPKEMRFLAAASEAIQAISSQELSSDDVADTILSVKEPFADSSLLPTVIPSFLSSAESKWNNGEAFLGIKSPFAAGSASGVMFTPVLHTFAEADDDAMREDGETLIEIMAIAAREGVLSKLKSDPLHLFADHEFSAGVIYEILESEHMRFDFSVFAAFGADNKRLAVYMLYKMLILSLLIQIPCIVLSYIAGLLR